MRLTLNLSWVVMCAMFGCAFGLIAAKFVPYNLKLTMLKSLPPGRLGSSVTCPDFVNQIPFSSYLDKLSSMIYLDVDYYSIVYNSTESNPPVRGVLMTPGQGGSCYEDLGDLTDIMPTGDLKDQCSRDIYKDVIKTELLMEGRTFKESCSIYVYPNCSRPSDDVYCVPCVNGRCSSPYDCNVVTGGCRGFFDCKHPFTDPFCNTTCPPDKYGPTCGQSCSSQCKPQLHSEDRNCSQSNGACLLGCIIGWQGTQCDQKCTPGTYGDGCKQTCVGNCLEDKVCSPFDGTCPKGCAAGWKNVHPCNQGCEINTYGMDCSERCSEGCVNGSCNVKDGTCLHGCLDGYNGNKCSGCPKGTYGSRCAFNCGLFCLDGTCDPINGVCLQPQCAEGWSGPKCDIDTCLKDFDEEFWFNIYTFAIGSGIGIGIAGILMIACFCFYRYRMQTHSRPMNRTDYSQSRTEERMELSPTYRF